LTRIGTAFAGRVAVSLARSIGLLELVTATLADNDALALRLARELALLGDVKRQLA
jgi:protein O-GlcNAc transferase